MDILQAKEGMRMMLSSQIHAIKVKALINQDGALMSTSLETLMSTAVDLQTSQAVVRHVDDPPLKDKMIDLVQDVKIPDLLNKIRMIKVGDLITQIRAEIPHDTIANMISFQTPAMQIEGLSSLDFTEHVPEK